MKLKLNEAGQAVLDDGKPVYVQDDGTETAVDVAALTNQAQNFAEERNRYHTELNNLKAITAAFEGMDAEAAKAALETVANLTDKKLVDAGEVQQIKDAMTTQWATKEAAFNAEIATRDTALYDLQVGAAFSASPFVTEQLSIPPDMAKTFFGGAFAIEEGKVVAKRSDGNPIMSATRIGEHADFEESITALVGEYPHKDAITKGASSGSGGGGGGSAAPSGDMNTQAGKLAYIKEHGPDAYAKLRFEQTNAEQALAKLERQKKR